MLQNVNMTVLTLGVIAIAAVVLFRRWAWLILMPPGMALLVYAIVHTFWNARY
jgi:hypothetical protein